MSAHVFSSLAKSVCLGLVECERFNFFSVFLHQFPGFRLRLEVPEIL